jgi:hypothetical protein
MRRFADGCVPTQQPQPLLQLVACVENLDDPEFPPVVEPPQDGAFTWRPKERFDLVFFGFWLSHIPPQLFESFWRLVADSIKPGGRVFRKIRSPHGCHVAGWIPPIGSLHFCRAENHFVGNRRIKPA